MDEIGVFFDLWQKAPQVVIGGVLVMVWLKLRTFQKHIEECDKTPKKTIVEKLDSLTETVKHLAANQEGMSTQLNILVGRQIERDKA
jgi:hypothetical protein